MQWGPSSGMRRSTHAMLAACMLAARTSLSEAAVMSRPSTRMTPPASSIMRNSAISSVVLPEPVRPTMPTWRRQQQQQWRRRLHARQGMQHHHHVARTFSRSCTLKLTRRSASGPPGK